MSAALKLDADQLRAVANFLDGLTGATQHTGVRFAVYSTTTIEVGDAVLKISWADRLEAYVIDELVGA